MVTGTASIACTKNNSEVQLFRALGGGWTENIAHSDESAQ